MIASVIGLAIGAALATAIATEVFRHQLLIWGVVDVPNERSSHSRPVVRGVGIGMAAVWVVTSAIVLVGLGRPSGLLTVVVMTAAVAGLGFIDDRYSVSPAMRLAAQVLICGAAVATGLGGRHLVLPGGHALELGIMAAPLWTITLVAIVNFFNFMDGIDGLVGGQTLLAAVALVWLGLTDHVAGLAAVSAVLAGVSAGFLVFNWSPARCFMGDAGSYLCGGALGGLWLLGQQYGVSPLLSLSPAAPFLLDATVTVIGRVLHGRPFWQPHRDHLYQRLAARWSHARAAITYLAAGAVSGAIGLGIAWGLGR